jgi:glucose-1-phosphate thymidylyltransferase
VAPDHEALRQHYEHTARPARLTVDFVVQPEARGTADALLAVEPWAGDRPFLVMNGDNLYPPAVLAAVGALDEPGLPGFDPDDLVRSSNIEASRVRAFAIIEVDGRGYLTHIVEKPSAEEAARAPRGALVSMNCWRFDTRIFDCCRDVTPSPRGELELPVAVGLAVARGIPFKVVPARGPVLDLSQRADAAEVTRRLAGVDARP